MARRRKKKPNPMFTFSKSDKRGFSKTYGISRNTMRNAGKTHGLSPSQKSRFKSLFSW